MLEGLVENLREGLEIGGSLCKFDDPLVATLPLGIHEYGCGGVFGHDGSRLSASLLQAFLGVVDDEFLAEGIDEALGASADDEFVGPRGGEAHRIAYLIAPQSARGRNNDGIVAPSLYLPQRENGCVGAAHLFEGNKLVENAVVEHEQHRQVGRVALETKEAFAGIIGFHIAHTGRAYQLLVLLAVGREGHAAMEEHFEVGPDLVQRGGSCEFHHPRKDGHHPRGDTADIRHVLVHGDACNLVALLLEIGKQGHALGRCAHDIDEGIDIFDEDGREVAHEGVLLVVVGRMATAEDECAAVKETAIWIVAQIEGHGIGATGIVCILQSLCRDGDELALVVGCSRGFGVPAYASGPEDVALAAAHSVDIGLQLFVGAYGHGACEVLVTAQRRIFI